MLDLAPASGQIYQLPFDNYEGPLVYLKPGEKIKIDDDELEIRFTPGHSPGHVCFYHEPGGFVISGDVLFNSSIGRTDLPGGDYDILINSIQTQLFTLPDETKVYPGHGPMTTVGFEKMNNPFVKLYWRKIYETKYSIYHRNMHNIFADRGVDFYFSFKNSKNSQ